MGGGADNAGGFGGCQLGGSERAWWWLDMSLSRFLSLLRDHGQELWLHFHYTIKIYLDIKHEYDISQYLYNNDLVISDVGFQKLKIFTPQMNSMRLSMRLLFKPHG